MASESPELKLPLPALAGGGFLSVTCVASDKPGQVRFAIRSPLISRDVEVADSVAHHFAAHVVAVACEARAKLRAPAK